MFSTDSPLMKTLSKIGNIIILNFLFLLGCIPIITIGTSISALYYAMMKSVRKERSYPMKEFLRAYKRNLVNGCLFTLGIAACSFLLYVNREYVALAQTTVSLIMIVIYDALFCLLVFITLFLFPVMSRFEMTRISLLRLSLIMTFKHLPYTICLFAGFIICVMLLLWVLPIPFLFILPGAWCYASTYLVERVFKHYMPKPKEGEDAWYYE